MRHINLVDNVIVERFRRDDAGFRQPRVQQALLKSRDKAAEDVARAEMHPHGLLGGLLRHLRPVVLRQRHLRGGVALLVLNALIGQFHIASPLCYPLIILFPNENAGNSITSFRPSCGRWLPTGRSGTSRPARGHTGRSRGDPFRPRSCGRGRGGCRCPGRCRR